MTGLVKVSPLRYAAGAVAAPLAVALQGTLIARLPLPGGGPNLVLVFVVGVALAAGATAGMAAGFGAGMLADLLSAHPVGVLALCFALVGFMVGLLDTSSERSIFWPVVVTALAAAGSYLAYAAVMSLLRSGSTSSTLGVLPETVLYDVMLTPFVVPVIAVVARRLDVEARR